MLEKPMVMIFSRRLPSFVKHQTYNLPIRCSSSGGLSYYHNPGKEPLKHITIGGLLKETANRWPDRKALVSVHQDLSLTFSQTLQQADMLASGLIEIGMKPGDKIAVMGPNNSHWYTVFMAAAKAGLILVNINPAFQTQEILYCLKKTDTKALICEEEFKTQQYYKMICEIEPQIEKTSSGSHFNSKSLPHFTTLIVNSEKNLSGAWRLKDLINHVSDDLSKLEKLIQPDDPCNIQFSSGTTGNPKAALLSHFTLINNSYIYGRVHGYSDKHHSMFVQVPFFHTAGTSIGILASLSHGSTLILPSPSFSSADTINAFKRERCSILTGTPTMFIDLCHKIRELNDPELKKNLNIDMIICGGTVCTPSLLRLVSETFNCTNMASAYGMTECSPVTMTNKEDDSFELRTTTVGHVADHCEVKVVDDNGKVVPFGTAGEAWFRTYSTMLGYYGDEKATQEAITKCGWIKTGDLLVLEENGYGVVIGRKKDIIIRGGENIFPAEIEEFLEKHPDILEAQIYGVADERMGEAVCASIKLKPNSKRTPDEIRVYCKGKIAHFKIPKYISIVDDFPKTASGKVQKFKLRQMMEDKLKLTEKSK